MASLNSVQLIGNVTRDIDLKYTQGGMAVCEVSVAVNNKYKNKEGEYVEEVTFVDVTCFGKTAELAGEYLGKGSSVFFGGRLKLDSWEKDGKKNYKLRVIGENMQFLGSKGGNDGPRRTNTERQDEPRQQRQNTRPPADEEIPF